LSDEAALLEELEKVIGESRKLRVRLALLQKQIDFYPLVSKSTPESGSLPEPAPNPQIAKSTFLERKAGAEGIGTFGGLRTVPPNPEPVRLFPDTSVLPVRAQNNDDALRGNADQPEPVTALVEVVA
jgi:hypothetical protein